jgi:hypothetical protein
MFTFGRPREIPYGHVLIRGASCRILRQKGSSLLQSFPYPRLNRRARADIGWARVRNFDHVHVGTCLLNDVPCHAGHAPQQNDCPQVRQDPQERRKVSEPLHDFRTARRPVQSTPLMNHPRYRIPDQGLPAEDAGFSQITEEIGGSACRVVSRDERCLEDSRPRCFQQQQESGACAPIQGIRIGNATPPVTDGFHEVHQRRHVRSLQQGSSLLKSRRVAQTLRLLRVRKRLSVGQTLFA